MAGIASFEVLDLLSSLVGKSLIVTEETDGEMRYRLLESIREYATDKLDESDEKPLIKKRHCEYFVALAEEAEPHTVGSVQQSWMNRLDLEHDNLRSALSWCSDHSEEAQSGLRMSGALWRFWVSRGHWREGLEHLERAISSDKSQSPTAARAVALRGAGAVATSLGDYAKAKERFEESLGLFRKLGDERGTAQALQSLGFVARNQGDYEGAQALHEECLRVFERLEDETALAWTHLQLGYVAFDRGDNVEARKHNNAALRLFRELHDQSGEANALVAGGSIDRNDGRYETARTSFESALEVFRALRDPRGLAWSLISIGTVEAFLGAPDQAVTAIRQGLKLFHELGDKDGTAYALEAMAVTAMESNGSDAVRMWAAASSIRQEMGAPIPLSEKNRLEQMVQSVREQLGEEPFLAAWESGSSMGLSHGVAYAMDQFSHGR